MLALLSAHWPNFWDVLVKVMLGVTVQLMMACVERHKISRSTGARRSEEEEPPQQRIPLNLLCHVQICCNGMDLKTAAA